VLRAGVEVGAAAWVAGGGAVLGAAVLGAVVLGAVVLGAVVLGAVDVAGLDNEQPSTSSVATRI
jgi:hypothetical protein